MTAAKTPQAASAEDTKTDEAKTPDAEQTVTLSLERLGELVAEKVAEAVAALPKGEVSQAAAPQTFQNTPFDKGGNQPRVVMTLGDPESSEGSVETRTVQARHAHILEALGWTGRAEIPLRQIGAAIAVHTGPHPLGVGVLGRA